MIHPQHSQQYQRELLTNLCTFINAVWAAFDDAEGGGFSEDGEEVVSIPLQRFNDACTAMDALDRMASDSAGWLGYRVKYALLSARKDPAP